MIIACPITCNILQYLVCKNQWVNEKNTFCCTPLIRTHMCYIWTSRYWQKSLEWKGNHLTKQLSNTFYLSGGQIAEKIIHKWACPRFKRCGSKEMDSWTSGLHTFVFLPQAGANYWPSAVCKLLSLSYAENSHIGECLYFSLKQFCSYEEWARKTTIQKAYGICLLACLLHRFSRVLLCATPWTAAYQAPPSMGFSRQQYWSGVPLPSPVGYVKERNNFEGCWGES